MIQEYLLQEPAERGAIKAYKPKDIHKRLFSADEGKCWYVQFAIDGENETSAKQLSALDEYVRANFNVTVLKNGCSAYFNKRLYPEINEFENGLRKLLYLTSAINHDEKSSANISDLESQDFGQIFTLLFIDTVFVGKAKETVKNRNRDLFSKAEVIAAIEAMDENTLWDALLGKDTVPTLRKRFNDVRTYRNDVMHSHYISWEKYRDILELYKTINTELDKALHEIVVVESKAISKPDFNQTLEVALRTQAMLDAVANAMKPTLEQAQHLSEIIASNTAVVELQRQLKEICESYPLPSETLREMKIIGQLASELLQNNQTSFRISDETTDIDAQEGKQQASEKDDKDGGAK